LNGNLDYKNNKNEYKIIKKYKNDKKLRIELSSSDNVNFSISYPKIVEIYRVLNDIKFEETKGLGKKYIDIDIETINNPLIFSIYQNNLTENKSVYYSFKYKTNKGSENFKNYSTFDDKEGLIENNYTFEENKINIHLKFPSIKDKVTSNKIKVKYYLKIYKYNENQTILNDTISVIDTISPIVSYEYNFEELKDYYEKDLVLLNYNNSHNYYVTLSAVVIDDHEFIGYKSFIINSKKEDDKKEDDKKEDDKKNDDKKDDDKKDDDKKKGDDPTTVNNNKWWNILIILLIILIIIIIILIVLLLKKNKKSIMNESINELTSIENEKNV